jgi:hypothetical protein
MKKLILPFVVALIAGIGVASGAIVMKKHTAPVLAAGDSLPHAAADSTAERVIDSTGVPHSAVATAAPDSALPAAVSDSAKPAPKSVKPALPVAVALTPPAGAVQRTPTPSVPKASSQSPAPVSPTERRLSRVFGSMAPKDAAKVLEQMVDPDVAIILGNLSEKQAAAILAQLPPPRVAALSRASLRTTATVK